MTTVKAQVRALVTMDSDGHAHSVRLFGRALATYTHRGTANDLRDKTIAKLLAFAHQQRREAFKEALAMFQPFRQYGGTGLDAYVTALTQQAEEPPA